MSKAEEQNWKAVQAEMRDTLRAKAFKPMATAFDSKEEQLRSGARSALNSLTGKSFTTRAEAEAWIKSQATSVPATGPA
jgi:hypothetical protein